MSLTMHGNQLKGLSASLACACMALSALADAPPANAQTLGITESLEHYCGSIDPAATHKLRNKVQQLTQGLSEQQLAAIRNSVEYHKGYDSVVEFAAKIDPHNAKRFCAETPIERK